MYDTFMDDTFMDDWSAEWFQYILNNPNGIIFFKSKHQFQNSS